MQHSPAQGAACPAGPGEVSTGSPACDQKDESAPLVAGAGMLEEEQTAQSNRVSEEEEVPQGSLSPRAESRLNPDKQPELAEQPVPKVDEDFVLSGQRRESSPIKKAETEHSPSTASLQAEVAAPPVLETRSGEVAVAVLPEEPSAEQKAEEPVGGLEPPPLSSEGGNCTDLSDGAGSDQEPSSVSTAEKSSAVVREIPREQELGSSPRQKDSR